MDTTSPTAAPPLTTPTAAPARSVDGGWDHDQALPRRSVTPETDWSTLMAAMAEHPLAVDDVVVVAPHPDDETLAVGGLLARFAAAGTPVAVLAATDGEASHPDRPRLAAERAAEQAAALCQLGLAAPATRLHLPDGRLADHEDELAQAIAARCHRGTTLLAPWHLDGHPDHDAAGRAARTAARTSGATLLSFPVWAWQWARPTDLAGLRAWRQPLRPAEQDAKARAVACFASQVDADDGDPILGDEVLARAARSWEVLFDG